METETKVYDDEEALAAAVAEAVVALMVAPGVHHLVATGGGVGTAVLSALRERSADVEWSRLHVWWGDERFLPGGHPERNETSARTVLLDHVPIPPDQVHPMPADEGQGPDEAAASYADELAAASEDGIAPLFDIVLLGMGPEGHVASIFPDAPAVHSASPVVAVRNCPKPPPTRVTMTLPLLRSADQVWIVTAGAAKAFAAAAALNPETSPVDVPAAGARGRLRTVMWLDAAAAGA
jgi:6-phosphogluconolactonase